MEEAGEKADVKTSSIKKDFNRTKSIVHAQDQHKKAAGFWQTMDKTSSARKSGVEGSEPVSGLSQHSRPAKRTSFDQQSSPQPASEAATGLRFAPEKRVEEVEEDARPPEPTEEEKAAADAARVAAEETTTANLEAVREKLPAGPRLCILGGTTFSNPASEELLQKVAEALAKPLTWGGAVVLTGGMPGVQKCVALGLSGGGFHNEILIQLLPEGQACDYGVGRDIACGKTLPERMEVFGRLGEVYLTAEGGPGVAKEAKAAFDRGFIVIPLVRTGGASSGMFDFPQKCLEKPEWASEEQWNAVTSEDQDVAVSASLIATLVCNKLGVPTPQESWRAADPASFAKADSKLPTEPEASPVTAATAAPYLAAAAAQTAADTATQQVPYLAAEPAQTAAATPVAAAPQQTAAATPVAAAPPAATNAPVAAAAATPVAAAPPAATDAPVAAAAANSEVRSFVLTKGDLDSQRAGVNYRFEPKDDAKDKYTKMALYGATVRGVKIDNDWVKVDIPEVGERYLPICIRGLEVLKEKLADANE